MIKLFVVLIFLVSNNFMMAQEKNTNQNVGNLIIVIKGIVNNKGDIKIGLFNSEESYTKEDEEFCSAILKINCDSVEWVVEKIPYGYYAIKSFHDEDGDNQLDKNFLGIPTESFWFSNNPTILFGPPSFEETRFLFNSDSMRIDLNLKSDL